MNRMWPAGAYGITSTIPLEIPLAAGKTVLDLNNRFVGSPHPAKYLRLAEQEGYPRTCCTWIKGLYGYIRAESVKRVIFVTGGDCSNTAAMLETLKPFLEEIKTFAYPPYPHRHELIVTLEAFARDMGTSLGAAEEIGRQLRECRQLCAEIDRLTWETCQVSGSENFRFLVASSDFNGDPKRYQEELTDFLAQARRRPTNRNRLRLGVLGVPPILTDLHLILEDLGCQIVFNEIPRQFSLSGGAPDLPSRYADYTYPYEVAFRMADITREILHRGLVGLIHYTQSFCHRQIHDMVIRRAVSIPMLTIEGENPGPCDARTRLRLESFLEILKEQVAA